MNKETENSSERALEVITENNSVSAYSVNFTETNNQDEEIVVSDEERKYLLQRPETEHSDQLPVITILSGKIFKWRNAIAVAAILAVGILHFAFQLSFQSEVSENRNVVEPPVVNKPAMREESVENEPSVAVRSEESESREIAPPRKNSVTVKNREPEIAPVKPQIRKKVYVETRAARLRRAEKILTGV